MSAYRDRIQTTLATSGNLGVDARHVEAWMILERGTLDALSPAQFDREVLTAVECVHAAPADSEALARSYGV